MKYQSLQQLINDGIKVGGEVYGCNHSCGMKPTKGLLSPTRYEKDYVDIMSRLTTAEINWFIPYNEKGKLTWKKACPVHMVSYASTEQESIEMYNEDIKLRIDACEKEIEKLRNELI